MTRGEARPLRSISNPMHLAMKRLATLYGGTACLMPTPRATWLEEPRSVDPNLSRPLSFSQTPPLRVRCRAAASCAVVSACAEDGESYLREPSPHSLARFRRHGRMGGTRSVVSCNEIVFTLSNGVKGFGCNTIVPRLAHPFVTLPPRSYLLAEMR